jgi:hypothetical protein
MMNGIRETVMDLLKENGLGHYTSNAQVGRIVDALEERESEQADALMAVASREHLNPAMVGEALAEAGMMQIETDTSETDAHEALMSRVERLENIARQHLGTRF